MQDSRYRIVVFDLPPLLRDLVCRELDANDDIASVVVGSGDLEQALADTRPDALIVPLGPDGPRDETRRFLHDRARMPVLGLGVRDGRAVLYELRQDRSELGEVVPADLPELLRTALAGEVSN